MRKIRKKERISYAFFLGSRILGGISGARGRKGGLRVGVRGGEIGVMGWWRTVRGLYWSGLER